MNVNQSQVLWSRIIRHSRILCVQIMMVSMALVFTLGDGLGEEPRTGRRQLSFHPGEQLVFQLRWGVIPAGEAVLEVLPTETALGIEVFHFAMTAKTYPIIDLFYKVRDRVDAYTDRKMSHSVLYKKRQLEGRTKRDVLVTFDWDRQEAQYSNFGKKKKKISVLAGSFDPLSALYAFRLHHLEENSEVRLAVTDGKKSIVGKARVIRREEIETGMGVFDTYVVEPELKDIRGVFEKSTNAKMKLWITADDRRIPVLLRSEVLIGSVVAELISINSGSRPGPASGI